MSTTQIKNGFQGGSDDQLLVNPDGSIDVNVTGGGGTSNVNITEIGGAPISEGQKTMANSLPVVIASDQSPVAVTGTVTAVNASVGLTGVTAPTSATEMGAVDASGNLQPLMVDPSGKLLVDISGTATISGTVNANIEGLNAFQTSQYTIGASASQLTPTPLVNRSSMSIKANSTNTAPVYIGNSSGVTASTGYALFAGDSLQLDLTPAQASWAISSLSNQLVYVLEIGS